MIYAVGLFALWFILREIIKLTDRVRALESKLRRRNDEY